MEPLCEPDEEAVSGGSEVRHKCRRSYDDDVNPSFSHQAADVFCRDLPCLLQESGIGVGTGIPQLFYIW